MQYLGGKTRLAKHIVPLMLRHNRPTYVEPFLGGGSVAEKMAPHFENVYLSDVHEDLILMWQALQQGWEPPDHVSEEEYARLKKSEPSALRGFVGFGCSFGGRWFEGYARSGKTNFAATSRRVVLRQIKGIGQAKIIQRGYASALEGVEASQCVVYCDPPYASTKRYSGTDTFNHDEFYRVVKQWADRGATVYVSEYNGHPDWELVYEREQALTVKKTSAKRETRTEKLWRVK